MANAHLGHGRRVGGGGATAARGAAAQPTCLYPQGPILEFDRTELPIRQAILTAPIEHDRGVVRVPDGPGLGIEIDRAALARFR